MARGTGLIFTPNLTQARVQSVQIDIEPSVGILARKVDKLGLDIRSFKEPLKRAVRDVMIPSIQMNFHKHGRPRWPELSDLTVAKKGHARPLHLTGLLRETMKQQNIWTIDQEKAMITDLPQKIWYGKVHQAGSQGDSQTFSVVNIGAGGAGQLSTITDIEEGDNSIPQRRFIMIQPEDEVAIERIFSEWLDERVLKAGLGKTRRVTGGL